MATNSTMKKWPLPGNKTNVPTAKWHRWLRGVILFFITGTLTGQSSDQYFSAGTEFHTIYTNALENGGVPEIDTNKRHPNYIYLIGNNRSCVNVQIPSLNYEKQVILGKNQVRKVQLPPNPVYGYHQKIKHTPHIISTTPITVVQGQNVDSIIPLNFINNNDSVLNRKVITLKASAIHPNSSVPKSKLSTHLIHAQARIETSTYNRVTAFEVSLQSLSIENNISIYYDAGTRKFNGGLKNNRNTTEKVTLNNGEQFSFEPVTKTVTSVSGQDATQWKSINSLKFKSYVTSDILHIQGGWTLNHGDFVHEELVLPNIIGRSFHIPPLKGYKGHIVSVHALYPNTLLNFNNQKTFMLDSLERLDTVISSGKHLTTSKPVALYGACQTTRRRNYPDMNNNMDAFFSVVLPGDNKQLTHAHFSTLAASDSNNHYMLALTTRSRDTAATTLDGNPLPSGSFELFSADSSWSYALVEVNRGVHQVRNPNGFNGFHYTYYKDPQGRNDIVAGNYGYNLAQSIIWPEDSFAAKAGPSPQQLRKFADLSNPVLCPGDSFYFRAPNQHHTTWQWRIGADTTFTQPTGNRPAPVLSHRFVESGLHPVIVADSSGCYAPDTLWVSVGTGPQLDFEHAKKATCRGYRVTLRNKAAVDSLRWIFPGSTDEQDTAVSFRYTGDKKVIAVKMIGYAKGCVDTLSRAITLREEDGEPLQIPNFISPNNDGINDAFCLPQAELLQGCYELQIFNRYGRQVFASQDPNECWKARSVTTGVYFYTLQIAGRSYQGSLHVNF